MANKKTLKTCFSQAASTTDSDHESTPSADLIGSNEDLLTEILVLLPAASILLFKSASKDWRRLLRDRCFTLRYDKRSISPGIFVRNKYVPFDVEDRSPPPDFYPDRNYNTILQSCNGLLFYCSFRRHMSDRKYVVLNPTTKQSAIIPSIPGGVDTLCRMRFVGLAYHQTSCPHYKVVCIHYSFNNTAHADGGLFLVQIYSSETGEWKSLNIYFPRKYHYPFGKGVYWNGAIYWSPFGPNPTYFDLNVLQPQKLPLPSPLPVRVASVGHYGDRYLPLYFGESRGHLHLVDTASLESRFHLNVYEMLGDHSGWFVKYKVELDNLPDFHHDMILSDQQSSGPHLNKFEIIDVVRGQEDADTFLVLRLSRKIIRYNILDKSFKTLFNQAYPGRIRDTEIHRYVQSLTSF